MIIQAVKMAWKSIASNKMRSFLTMLGIIIGVASLIVLVSIAGGATNSVTDQISNMGTNLLTVSIQDDKENPLRLTELSSFSEDEAISMVAPYAQGSVTAKSGYTSESMTVYGTAAAYCDIQGLELYAGRFLKTTDVDNHTYVVVVNEYAATELIGRTNAVGETIALDGKEYLIIGVLAEEDTTIGSTTERLEAYIPFTSLTRLVDNVLYVTNFYAASADEESMDAAEAALTEKMLERFGQDEDAFTIVNQSTLMETMSSVTNTLAIMLGGIAAISLVVGGIGIMNIMLVSVTERTKEIGIRKAIGAGRGGIMLQFLIEALMLSLMGCAVGIGISWIILQIAGMVVTDMTFTISQPVVAIAVLFSAGIGVIFGLYPANKAAKKHPIDALRFAG